MLQGISKWFAYIVLSAIVVLVVLSLAGQVGVVRDLKQHILIAQKAGIPHISLQEVIRLHRRFTGLLILSFSGFLLVVTGILTVMQHLRDAFLFSETQDKVRSSLRKTAPGTMMLVIGALALAVANYGYSYLEHRYSGIITRLHHSMLPHTQTGAPVQAVDNASSRK